MSSVGTIIGDSFSCGVTSKKILVTYKFKEGSIVYSIPDAKRGILEVIAIKRVQLICNKKTYDQIIALYIDTYNSYWNEYDLCTEAEAVSLAINYLQRQQQLIEEELEK